MQNTLSVYHSNRKQSQSQDTLLWQQVHEIFNGFEQAAYADELKPVFEHLNDNILIDALEKTRWTGRPGYPVRVMWQTWVASHVLNIPSIQELIRTLSRNPFLALQCGIRSGAEIPSRFAYYRFIRKLCTHIDQVEICMAQMVSQLIDKLPHFGEVIAVDSTDIKTYSNRYKQPLSDKDAGWGHKEKSGEEYIWFGYKMHLPADAVYEIPLIPLMTPANSNDSPLMLPALRKNLERIKGLNPKYILGDKGYDAKENYRAIMEDLKAVPIIDINLRSKKGKPASLEDIADEYGTPYCAWGVPMVFWGYSRKEKRLKYRCPLHAHKKGCTWVDKCSKSSYGHVVKIRLPDDYRRFIAVPRHTKKWQELYNKRTSIERIFSRLKKDGNGRVVNHFMRGLNKITVNCLTAVWVAQAKKLSEVLKPQ